MIEHGISLASNGVVKVPGYEPLLRFGYAKNRSVYRLAVTASGEWEGLAIRCFWHVPDGKDPPSSLVVDGYVDVPASVTAQSGNGCITFEGSDGTKTVTSADLRYRVSANSGTEDGTEPEPGTPAWQQLVDAVHTDAATAEQAKTDAQTAAQQAADSLQELKDGIASGDFKGEKGEQGDTGPRGEQGPQGEKGDTGPAVALDTTLTHEGEAADAKATGDAISAVKTRQNILTGSETGNPLSVDDAFPAPLCGLTVYGKSTQDGTPTPDAPVPIVSAGDSGSVAVKVTGANILYLPDIEDSTVGGITYSIKNGVIKIKGTSTGKSVQLLRNIKLFVGTCVFNPNPVKGTESLNCYLDLTNTINLGFSLPSKNINKPVKITELNVKHPFYLNIESTADSVIDMEWKPQMLLSDKLLPYSPYHEQLFTLPTPNGLPGIPVTSGGNYTDPQGQRWVCDEVDLERGVKVQRIGKKTITSKDIFFKSGLSTNDVNYFSLSNVFTYIGTSGKKNALMSNRFVAGLNQSFGAAGEIFLGSISGNVVYFSVDTQKYPDVETFKQWAVENGLMFLYQLTDIIETPLTPDEIAAYKALTAYGPDTVVQAGDGAGIKLDYQRDVNLVVKRIEDAIASMTTT